MNSWLRRLRGALGMGLVWAGAGFLAGLAVELFHNIWPTALGSAVDLWPIAFAVPGFFGGLGFSAVLGIAGRRRRFDELSLPAMVVWGALGGLVASLIPATIIAYNAASAGMRVGILTVSLVGPFAVGGGLAAAATLAIARRADDRDLLDHGRDVGDAGLSDDEARELLGGGG